jgi:hypothetical protein
MFEKPQYLTPGGYKRLSQNPYKKQLQALNDAPVKSPTTSLQKKPPIAQRQRLLEPRKKQPQFELSDKAAMLIAQALKGMLKK